MKKIAKLLVGLLLCAALLPACLTEAHASDLDYIDYCHMSVQPNTEDGSLLITAAFRWTVLDQGPVEWLQIGIPNGSIRETNILTDNIRKLSYDNSYMRVDFADGYDTGETFEFSYSWVQEYMYALGADGSVSFTYTPGWFDEAEMGEMTVTWIDPAGTAGDFLPDYGVLEGGESSFSNGGCVMTARNLPHGARLTLSASYAQWPVALGTEGSIENLPADDYSDYDDWYDDGSYYEEDDGGDFVSAIFVIVFIIVVFIVLANASDGYNGGFGNTYIFYNGLWYPRGPGGRPRPGSVGVPKKPAPPPHSGGFGGGSRGGGFGGGGFGGGSHGGCASSCACACACACAGGGRAGCSAKNLYGAVGLSRKLTARLSDEETQR